MWYMHLSKTGANTLMRLISSFYLWSQTNLHLYFVFPISAFPNMVKACSPLKYKTFCCWQTLSRKSSVSEHDKVRDGFLLYQNFSPAFNADYQLPSQKKSLTKGHQHSPYYSTNSKQGAAIFPTWPTHSAAINISYYQRTMNLGCTKCQELEQPPMVCIL